MDKINFQNGTKVSDAKVTISGVNYPVTPAVYTGSTPLSAYTLNLLQSNIEDAIPLKVSDLTNDSGFIDNTVNNLTNYYTKTQTYTKTEVDTLIAAIPRI